MPMDDSPRCGSPSGRCCCQQWYLGPACLRMCSPLLGYHLEKLSLMYIISPPCLNEHSLLRECEPFLSTVWAFNPRFCRFTGIFYLTDEFSSSSRFSYDARECCLWTHGVGTRQVRGWQRWRFLCDFCHLVDLEDSATPGSWTLACRIFTLVPLAFLIRFWTKSPIFADLCLLLNSTEHVVLRVIVLENMYIPYPA